MSPECNTVLASYFDSSGRDDVLSGGVRMIPIETPKGTFKVWTRRVGNNPTIKVLLLHGGPGGSSTVSSLPQASSITTTTSSVRS